jgi:hypothetical protein
VHNLLTAQERGAIEDGVLQAFDVRMPAPAARKRPFSAAEEAVTAAAAAGLSSPSVSGGLVTTAPKQRGRPKGKRPKPNGGAGSAASLVADAYPTFEEMLFQLMLYKAEHGTCTVPKTYDGHRNLGRWASELRNEHLRGGDRAPTPDQVTVLRTVGFPLLPASEQVFQDRLRELRAFKEQHGHCQVPTAKAGALGRWVNAQRVAYSARSKQGSQSPSGYVLTQSRIDALNELGFIWKINDRTSFSARFEELKAFKAVHGHTKVPQHYQENKPLGKWVTKQRYSHTLKLAGEKTGLTDERIAMLNEIGFEWNVIKTRRNAGED